MAATTARYSIISTITHARGSHARYRDYLEESIQTEFDAWRNKYKNPFGNLRDTSDRVSNWDSERRTDFQSDGVVRKVIVRHKIHPRDAASSVSRATTRPR